jgi:FkbM family methyltransferase
LSDTEDRKLVDRYISEAVLCAQSYVDNSVQIPSVSLEAVLGLIPSDLLISVQIDTNGNEFDVFKGARAQMRRILSVTLALQNVSQGAVGDYSPASAMKLPQVAFEMKDIGYVLDTCRLLQCAILYFRCQFFKVGFGYGDLESLPRRAPQQEETLSIQGRGLKALNRELKALKGLLTSVGYCWTTGFTYESCCDGRDGPQKPACFDDVRMTERECCNLDFFVIDPFGIPPLARQIELSLQELRIYNHTNTRAKTMGSSQAEHVHRAWDMEKHPSNSPDQLLFERVMEYASIPVQNSTLAGIPYSWRAYKGSKTFPVDYNLDSKQLNSSRPVFVDAGAKYGEQAIAMARRWPNSLVVALEPNPLLCRFMIWNLKLNNVTQHVWPLCAGLGESNDTHSMQLCKSSGPDHSETCESSAQPTMSAEQPDNVRPPPNLQDRSENDASMYSVSMITL